MTYKMFEGTGWFGNPLIVSTFFISKASCVAFYLFLTNFEPFLLMIKSLILYTLSFFLISLFSQDLRAQNYKTELGFTTENDLYIDPEQDRYYTNGLLLQLRHAFRQDTTVGNLEKRIFELELGHKLFSPYSAKAPNPALHDRPFTAYLYVGGTYDLFYNNESLLKLSAQFGTIGPRAKGRELQVGYHKWLKIYPALGWEYQLNNEYGLNLAADYNKLLYRFFNKRADLIGNTAAMLGNTFSGANVGFTFRLGLINPINQSVTYNSRISNNTKENPKPQREIFLFAKPLINYVAYDATIEGGLFIKDKGPITFNAKPWVYSIQSGVSFAAGRWSASYVLTNRSKDVESTAKSYRYASLIFFYRVNK